MSAPPPGLSARLVVHRERFQLDVELEVAPGEVVALLGPNGAGKSTSLQALAGLVPLSGGSLHLAGRCWDDPAAGVLVPTADRGVGVVFQEYLLFPHLSALENVAFGLRAGGTPRKAARARARTWLERMGLAELAGVKPRALSGGQAQRVALARALAPAPGLLLLDEPLAALDAGTRMQVRSDLRHHLAGFAGCTVLVTHDPLDAMVLADRLVVVEQGRVVQTGTPAEVARAPRTDYVARLVGLNLYRGRASGRAVALADGGRLQTADSADGEVLVTVRPSAVALHRSRPEGSARNAWQGRVAGIEQHGDTIRVQVDGPPAVLADVTPGAVADLGLTLGTPVWVSVKATEVHLDAAGTAAVPAVALP
jgi:molybdate transport system ATP-binding protein